MSCDRRRSQRDCPAPCRGVTPSGACRIASPGMHAETLYPCDVNRSVSKGGVFPLGCGTRMVAARSGSFASASSTVMTSALRGLSSGALQTSPAADRKDVRADSTDAVSNFGGDRCESSQSRGS